MQHLLIRKRGSIFLGLFLGAILFSQHAIAHQRETTSEAGVHPFYLTTFAGAFHLAGDTGEVGSGSALAVGIGLGYRWRDHLAFEFEASLAGEDYEAPGDDSATFPLLVYNSETMYLDTESFFVNAKGIYPMRWFEPYIGGGIGITHSTLEVPAYLFGFIPGTSEDESDISVSAQVLVGADFVLGKKWVLGLDYRHVEADADFGQLSGGTVDIGGDVLALNVRYHFQDW